MRYLCFIFFLISVCSANDRRLTATLNPKCPLSICPKNDTLVSVVHIVATGKNDIIHYVWDLTGTPSVLLAVTPLTSTLIIKWDDFINGERDSIFFVPEPPTYSFCIVINKIMEFNDVNNTGIYTNETEFNMFDTKGFSWMRDGFISENDTIELSVSSKLYRRETTTRNGIFHFLFKSFSMRGHGPVLPHLLHSANSSQIDFVLENIQTDPKFNSSRFAVELLIVSQESKKDLINIDTKKSLDDEHTPGIFEVVEIQTSISRRLSAGGFIQYRPISYTNAERSVTDSTEMQHSTIVTIQQPTIALDNTLASAYYGAKLDQFLVQGLNVSFGAIGDGFYKKSNYTTWTFTVGYGAPPEEQFSLLVILVISIGLGLPCLLMVVGGFYFCCRKMIFYRNAPVSSTYR